MKNTIKRIVIIFPVIALFFAFLVVPASADGIDGGVIDPVTFDGAIYYVGSSLSDKRQVNVTLGESLPLEQGETYLFTYLLHVDLDSLVGSSFYFPRDQVYVVRLTFDSGLVSTYIFSSLNCDGSSLRYQVLRTTDGSSNSGSFSLDSLVSLEIMCSEDVLPNLTQLDFTYYTLSSSPAEPIGNVWTEIMTWITSALTSVMGAFYVDGSLTLLGTLAVIGVSVGIGFLLIGLIQRFLHLRG